MILKCIKKDIIDNNCIMSSLDCIDDVTYDYSDEEEQEISNEIQNKKQSI